MSVEVGVSGLGVSASVQRPGRRDKREVKRVYESLEDRGKRQRQDQQAWYAKGLFWVMVLQLAAVDGIFGLYAWLGWDWKVPEGAIQVWVSATFVQVVGVVYVIARELFRDKP